MEYFDVQVVKGFSITPNYHQRDRTLSMKAKGILSLMFSLPDDWDYTLKGLAYLSTDGIDSIRSGIQELERAGYIFRSRIRDDHGHLRGTKYKVYPTPQSRLGCTCIGKSNAGKSHAGTSYAGKSNEIKYRAIPHRKVGAILPEVI